MYLSDTSIKNHILADPILDWLNLYHDKKLQDPLCQFSLKIAQLDEEFLSEFLTKFETKDAKNDPVKTLYYIKKGYSVRNCCLIIKLSDSLGVVKSNYDLITSKGEGGEVECYMTRCSKLPLTKSGDLNNQKYTQYQKSLIMLKTMVFEKCFPKIKINWIMVGGDGQRPVNDYRDYIQNVVEGLNWQTELYKSPGKITDFYPNMKNTRDYPWKNVKKQISHSTREISLLPGLTTSNRFDLLSMGVHDFNDLLSGDMTKHGECVRWINDGSVGRLFSFSSPADLPPSDKLMFYVDFETSNKLVNGIDLIFQIGLGYFKGEWIYHSFCVNELSLAEESRIIQEWLNEMRKNQESENEPGIVVHWSHAERSFLRKRFPEIEKSLQWHDLMDTAKKMDFCVVGCFGYGLKSIIKCLNSLGLVSCEWEDSMIASGMDVLALLNLSNPELMNDVVKYNQVDCFSLLVLVDFFRKLY